MRAARAARSNVISAAERTEIVERAIREGRHEADMSTWRTVCQGCREWVPAIWFVTEAGVQLCRACAPKDRNGK